MSIEAMKQALEALKSCGAGHITDGGNQWHDEKLVDKAIKALEAALEAHKALANHCEDNLNMVKQEQSEPVAWINWCAATGKRSVSFECESELASQPLYFGVTQITQKRYSNQNSLADERLELVGHADLAINNIYIFSGYGEDVPEGRTPIYAGYKAAQTIKENT